MTNESGPQPITIAEIAAYAEYAAIDGEFDRDLLLEAIRALDRMWLDAEYARRQAEIRRARVEAERKSRSRRR